MWEGLSAVLNLQNYTMALSIYNNLKKSLQNVEL